MKININTKQKQYNIIVGENLLSDLQKIINENLPNYNLQNKKILIITDNLIPEEYLKTVQEQLNTEFVKIIFSGEESKSIRTYEDITSYMLENNFHKNDLIISLGGGVVCDLAGFVASTYMRGIDIINIPTTLLSQVDSSIGGKNALNLLDVKNVLGRFYQPNLVVIDINTLKTLSFRHFINGIAECIKMGTTLDETLFNEIKMIDMKKYIKDNNLQTLAKYLVEENIEKIKNIIIKSINAKKNIVEKDEYDKDIRKVLNFGHTIGHGIESYFSNEKLLHGECIALGMLCMVNDEVKNQLEDVYKNYYLQTKIEFDENKLMEYIIHDKKNTNNQFNDIICKKIGTYEEKCFTEEEIKERLHIIQ